MCDAEGGTIERYKEKAEMILEFMAEHIDDNIEREDLFRKIREYQILYGKGLFDIKQRSCDHFYCPDLAEVLARMEFYGLLRRETEWIKDGFYSFYSITELGSKVLNKEEEE